MVICPECDNEYTNLGMHWSHNPSHRISFTDNQKEIIKGLLMGDGHLNRGGKNPYINVNTIAKDYLEYLDGIFGVFSTGVRLFRTAEENAEVVEDYDLIEGDTVDGYNDIYWLKTRSHPELKEYTSWYTDEGKLFPDDVELTPTSLKHWYCGDGNIDTYPNKPLFQISSSNESENDEKLLNIFNNSGLPEPNLVKQTRDGVTTTSIRFTSDESQKLWEYMGEPLPDFEYKWPEEYRT